MTNKLNHLKGMLSNIQPNPNGMANKPICTPKDTSLHKQINSWHCLSKNDCKYTKFIVSISFLLSFMPLPAHFSLHLFPSFFFLNKHFGCYSQPQCYSSSRICFRAIRTLVLQVSETTFDRHQN